MTLDMDRCSVRTGSHRLPGSAMVHDQGNGLVPGATWWKRTRKRGQFGGALSFCSHILIWVELRIYVTVICCELTIKHRMHKTGESRAG